MLKSKDQNSKVSLQTSTYNNDLWQLLQCLAHNAYRVNIYWKE